MTILDWKKLSKKESDALPCVCCGNPFGTTPCSDTYWICSYCTWEEESDQFRNPWQGGGPNGDSLWESRRNYRFTGSVYHAEHSRMFKEPSLKLFRWDDVELVSEDQYCWETDPKMYVDYAGDSKCPLRFCRDVLRAFGAFSGRQMLQKIVLLQKEVPANHKISFEHFSVCLSPREPLVRSVLIDITPVNSESPEFMKRLNEFKLSSRQECGIQFFNRPSNSEETVFAGSSSDRSDKNEYWYILKFHGENLHSLEIQASADGMSSFDEMDKDAVKQ